MTNEHDDSGRRDDHAATEFEQFIAEHDLDEIVLDAEGAGTDEASEAAAEPESEPESEVDVLTRELQQFKDTALRIQADFENYRKRVAAQQTAEIDRAVGKVVESMLPVLDACEAAFTHRVEGIEPIWSQLMGVLQKHGLEALDLADKAFDPAQADAVVHEAGDGAPDGGPVVTDVLRTGYAWKGKTLRPAMVKVRG
jgi:molecular chaperone GrpE